MIESTVILLTYTRRTNMRHIYLGNDHILSVTDFNQPDLHKHWAKHVAISLDKKIEVVVGKNKIKCSGIIINSNVVHAVSCISQKHLVFTFEEGSNIAREIDRKCLLKSDFYLLDETLVEDIKREVYLHSMMNNTEYYYETYNTILNLLGLQRSQSYITDERIVRILELIKAKEEINNNIISEILEMINISQSRLSHLFKEQVGVSLNSYLVMIKLKKAYKYISEGQNFTNAALTAGFDSASHFAATSKHMIGFSAKKISQECDIIEIKV